MPDMERSAEFYLGRVYDLKTKQASPDLPVLYDARDLTTHAVCVGMTGSGKTGLCIDLLEEAALDGVPAIIIDPKGDMTNLLLTFPELRPADFEPWVNVDDARRKNQTTAEYAATMAETWAKGLAQWGQSPERIRRLRDAAEFVVYTPGSDAGIPVSVLHSLRAPSLSWDDHEETLRELVAGTVSALLGLVGVEADPIRSREHILLANIFELAWRRGQDLDLAQLIEAIQRPPMRKLGVFDVDAFFPVKERSELAMALNSVVASPSFENWLNGAPLDIETIIHTPQGKPRVAVFYIAHLDDAQRMFFVTLLLEQVVSWMRQLSGTTSLRCLLYFDELFGYFPPHPANPPSKRPLLTLMKTARAFGLGVVLATQNPVDLDYKGLSNAGTWFIGKLQTERDKLRLLEGMDAVADAGSTVDRGYLDKAISSLDQRVFVLHNVHAPRPIQLMTRWALSYLRGPLTRSQVRTLMQPMKAERAAGTDSLSPRTTAQPPVSEGTQTRHEQPFHAPEPQAAARTLGSASQELEGYAPVQPQVDSRVAQFFLPVAVSAEMAKRREPASSGQVPRNAAIRLVCDPYLVALASVSFSDAARTQERTESLACLMPMPEPHALVRWQDCVTEKLRPGDLGTAPVGEPLYGTLPQGMSAVAPYSRLRADFVDYVFREQTVSLLANPSLKLQSHLDESERDFRLRCQEEARQRRDREVDQIKAKYERQLERLRAALQREEEELKADEARWEGRKRDELVSAGETVLGMLMGRRATRGLSQASSKRRMTSQAKVSMQESRDTIARLQKDVSGLQTEQEGALQQVRERWADAALRLEETPLRPKKTDIRVEAFGLAWVPCWVITHETGRGTSTVRVSAYPAE